MPRDSRRSRREASGSQLSTRDDQQYSIRGMKMQWRIPDKNINLKSKAVLGRHRTMKGNWAEAIGEAHVQSGAGFPMGGDDLTRTATMRTKLMGAHVYEITIARDLIAL